LRNALKSLAWMALLVGLAVPAAGVPTDAAVHWASEPGTLVLAVGGLAAMRVVQLRRRRKIIFPLFERDSA
jgi:hypothetical protein